MFSVWKGIAQRGPLCDRWQNFAAFWEDMFPRPPGFHLHRIDRKGDYEPGNCYWIDPEAHRRLHMFDKAQRHWERVRYQIATEPPPKPAPPVIYRGYKHLLGKRL